MKRLFLKRIVLNILLVLLVSSDVLLAVPTKEANQNTEISNNKADMSSAHRNQWINNLKQSTLV